MPCCRLLTFFKIIFFKKFFHEHYQNVKQFGSRSEPTLCRSWSGSNLFAKIISRQLKSPIARKELKLSFFSYFRVGEAHGTDTCFGSFFYFHISFLSGKWIIYVQELQIFSRLVSQSDPCSKKWWVIFWIDGPKSYKTILQIWHLVVYFTQESGPHIRVWNLKLFFLCLC